MKHELHPDALTEYEQAARYYAVRDPRVAERFIEAVEEVIQRIVDAPTRWRIIDDDVRRCLTRVFPFGILYTLESDHILILAVMNCSREPNYWRARK